MTEYKNPNFSEKMILEKMPVLFQNNLRKFKKILNEGKIYFETKTDWLEWLQSMEKENRFIKNNQLIQITNFENLSPNIELRNFLIAKVFFFLLKRPDVLLD